ncbi:histone-lysine N-methyltransferase, H3 lysine-9 specific SUVH3-like [Trifolium pratense]|nr:histone-lysine N-methyltransferase, H3 lysine-9 specific SUVH3-like [Trifolium pratense]
MMENNNTVNTSESIDKSKIVEVKPLRSLAPVLPPNNVQSFFNAQYPNGFSPFCSFVKPQQIPVTKETEEIPVDCNATVDTPVVPKATQETPVAAKVTPIRSYKSSHDEEVNVNHQGDGNAGSAWERFNGDDWGACSRKRATQNIENCKEVPKRKKKKKTREPSVGGSSSYFAAFPYLKEDGNRESVDYVLMTFDSIRRKLCQLEESKEFSNALAKHLRASNALTCHGVKTNTRRRAGAVPGIEVGDIFFFRMEMCLVGLHGQSMGGIDYMNIKDGSKEDTMALSVVSSGVYGDESKDNDVLYYSGQGENFNKKDKHVTDQKLQRGNLALERSAQRHDEVRVIRGLRDTVNRSAKIYMYDGLYKIEESWLETEKSGGGVFKYKMVRLPGQKSAFASWMLAQKWKADSSSRNGFILPDLSNKIESIPVSLVNDVDHEKGPAFFTYFMSLKNPKPFGLVQPSFGCNCKDCIPGDLNCSCIQRNDGDFAYTANSILVSRKPLIHECGPMCRCFPNCKNRVSQTGLKQYMEVFKTKGRGWGLRTLDPIRAGTFICEYAGEVIDRERAYQNREGENDEYVFDTSRIYVPFTWNHDPNLLKEVVSTVSREDYTIPSPLIISAKNVGNVARFMNHSCSPNVFWQPVLYGENNQSVLHIAFFALRHIPPMAELTYDYGVVPTGRGALRSRKKCLCGSENCRSFFG